MAFLGLVRCIDGTGVRWAFFLFARGESVFFPKGHVLDRGEPRVLPSVLRNAVATSDMCFVKIVSELLETASGFSPRVWWFEVSLQPTWLATRRKGHFFRLSSASDSDPGNHFKNRLWAKGVLERRATQVILGSDEHEHWFLVKGGEAGLCDAACFAARSF